MKETKEIVNELLKLVFEADTPCSVLSEAADRLEKQQKKIRSQRREIEALQKDKHRVDGFVNWLDAEIRKCEDHPSNPLLSVDSLIRRRALLRSKKQLEKLRNGLGEQKAPITRPAQAESITEIEKK